MTERRRTRWKRWTVVFLLVFTSGAGVRTLFPKSEAAERRESIVLRIQELLGELRSEGLVHWTDDRKRSFVEDHIDDFERSYVELYEEEQRSKQKLASLIEKNYTRAELEYVVPVNPKTAEYFLFITTHYDGKPLPIPIDGGEWDGYFRRSRFGLGMNMAFKSYLLDAVERHAAQKKGA